MSNNHSKTIIKSKSCQEPRGKIRVRLAPSPTGWLHIGTARTALFNYLFAKRYGGKFILRIEDTDVQRCQPKYEKDILESLLWLGLKWDEGPTKDSPSRTVLAPRTVLEGLSLYRQSERKEIYRKYIQKLLDSGQAFWCYHTKEELEAEKKDQIARKEAPRHVCQGTVPRGASGDSPRHGIIRFHPLSKKVVFNDLIRGQIEFETSLLGDFSIAKDLDRPLYNLAVVIDDAEMKISHVIRGEDMLANTPKQILLYQALGLAQPEFAHMTITLGPDKAKLSKRHGAVAIHQYRADGYLPEALINFMALLGWNPGDEREIFSLKELEKEFSIERMGKAAAIFNLERLDYLNGYYIRQMDLDELTKLCLPYLEQYKDRPWRRFQGQSLKKIVALEQERLKKLSEIGELTKFFFQDKLDYQPELLKWKKMSFKQVKENLDLLEKTLFKLKKTDFQAKKLDKALMPLAKKRGSGELLWPLRVALTGRSASPGPFEIAEILGKERVLKRIREAISRL